MNKVINSHLEPYTLSPPIHAHRSYLTDYTITQNPITIPNGPFCPGSVVPPLVHQTAFLRELVYFERIFENLKF